MTEAVVGKTRIGWIDVLRGFGVVLMIVGHVDFGTPFDRYVHAFHMPLFSSFRGSFSIRERAIASTWRTISDAYPSLYVFFLICQPLRYLRTGGFDLHYAVESYFCSNYRLVDVAGALWFLPCLFFL